MGSGWTSGSIGASTSARYSGPVYCRGGSPLGGEEIVEDAVELLGTLRLRSVAGALQHCQPRPRDQRVGPGRMCDWEQRIVGAPDDLHRRLQLAQAPRHVVIGGQERLGGNQRADRGKVRVRIAVG